ncbi:hypothetical protein Bca4012_083969 [Brassica carinata]
MLFIWIWESVQFMTQDGDEAVAQEDEKVVKKPEIEKKRDPEPEFEKEKDKKERKHKALKEKEMDNAASKDFETAINHQLL